MEGLPFNLDPVTYTPMTAEERRNRARTVRHNTRTHERARRSHAGLLLFLTLSSLAISMSANILPNRSARQARRQLLLQHWDRLAGDLVGLTGPRPL